MLSPQLWAGVDVVMITMFSLAAVLSTHWVMRVLNAVWALWFAYLFSFQLAQIGLQP